jgi:hypothetical protein
MIGRRDVTGLVQLSAALTQVEAATDLLREASTGYLAGRAREDASMFDAVSVAASASMRASSLILRELAEAELAASGEDG